MKGEEYGNLDWTGVKTLIVRRKMEMKGRGREERLTIHQRECSDKASYELWYSHDV